MKQLLEDYSKLRSIILRSKKFDIQKDYHLFVLLEAISKQLKSEPASKVLRLMDRDVSYEMALQTVLNEMRAELEKELNLYI